MGKNKRKSIERVILNAFSCWLHKTILLIVTCSNCFWAMIYLICDFEIIPKGIFDMIYMFLADGFEEVEALCPLDILRRAGLEVTTVGVGGKDTVVGSHGIAVQADIPDIMYRDSSPDMIILPSGIPGSKNLDESKIVDAALRVAAKKGAYLCAIFAAPMVLGKRGYLEGKKAVCYPGFEQFLSGATVSETETVVKDGNIIAAKGMGAAFEFGLELVRALKDGETAEGVKKSVFAK